MAYCGHAEFLLPLLFMLVAGSQGDTCTTGRWYNWDTSQYSNETTYCFNGCCGTFPKEYCCPDDYYDDNFRSIWLVWAIVGGVLGLIVVVSVIIALVCIFRKRQGQRGQVIGQPGFTSAPNTVAHTNMAYSGTSGQNPMQYTYPAPGQGVDQPPPPPYTASQTAEKA